MATAAFVDTVAPQAGLDVHPTPGLGAQVSPGVFTGNAQQLSGWSARYELINRRDPASPSYATEWRGLLRPANAPYQASVNALDMALSRWNSNAEP